MRPLVMPICRLPPICYNVRQMMLKFVKPNRHELLAYPSKISSPIGMGETWVFNCIHEYSACGPIHQKYRDSFRCYGDHRGITDFAKMSGSTITIGPTTTGSPSYACTQADVTEDGPRM